MGPAGVALTLAERNPPQQTGDAERQLAVGDADVRFSGRAVDRVVARLDESRPCLVGVGEVDGDLPFGQPLDQPCQLDVDDRACATGDSCDGASYGWPVIGRTLTLR